MRLTNLAIARRLARVVPKVVAVLREKCLLPLNLRHTEVELVLLPNVELRRLKLRFLKKDVQEVDVLAFPTGDFPAPDAPSGRLGEVYLNQVIARRDPDRALYLLIHGILHLAGFSHGRKRDTIRMEKLEREICRAVQSDF